MKGSAVLGRLRGSERGTVSVSGVIVLALVGGLAYALFGAVATDPDRYGRVGIPSNSWVALPGAETGIGISGDSARAGAVPGDLRIQVIDPRTGESLRVSSRGGSGAKGGEGRSIAAVDPPSAGTYQVIVSTGQAPAAGGHHPQLSFGQSPVGAVGDRFSQIGSLLIGPAGIVVASLLVLILMLPRAQRILARRSADSFG